MSIRRKSFLGKNDDLTRSNSIMKRVSNRSEKKSFKVVVVGAAGVGKSALTVRAKTRKFIHDYAPNMESRVSFVSNIDEESVNVEVWDTAALQTAESEKLEEKIKWADAYILVYSITDAASLSALVASKCLINLYAKKRKKSVTSSGGSNGFLVALVGNKNDMKHERMVTEETGRVFAEVHECTHFFELSTRESYDSVKTVFESLYKAYNLRSPKHSIKHSPKSSTLPIAIPYEVSETALIQAARHRDRKRTTITLDLDTTKLSPVTFRKITEATSLSSSSPDEDTHHFIGEEIIFDSPEDIRQSQRRITLAAPPVAPKKSVDYFSLRRQRKSGVTVSHYKDSNNNGTSSGSN